MNRDEKLKKACYDFSLLSEDQQDYILGIMNALAFANSTKKKEIEKFGAGSQKKTENPNQE